jgi:hypothetical protein
MSLQELRRRKISDGASPDIEAFTTGVSTEEPAAKAGASTGSEGIPIPLKGPSPMKTSKKIKVNLMLISTDHDEHQNFSSVLCNHSFCRREKGWYLLVRRKTMISCERCYDRNKVMLLLYPRSSHAWVSLREITLWLYLLKPLLLLPRLRSVPWISGQMSRTEAQSTEVF